VEATMKSKLAMIKELTFFGP